MSPEKSVKEPDLEGIDYVVPKSAFKRKLEQLLTN